MIVSGAGITIVAFANFTETVKETLWQCSSRGGKNEVESGVTKEPAKQARKAKETVPLITLWDLSSAASKASVCHPAVPTSPPPPP